jgi:hypothetical protein
MAHHVILARVQPYPRAINATIDIDAFNALG